MERVAIFIDGSNLYHSLKKYKIKIRLEDLIKKLESKREIIKVYYYTALFNKNVNEEIHLKHKKFIEKLNKIENFEVILCNLKEIKTKDNKSSFQIKGDDIHLATDLIRGVYEDKYDIAIIVSGDEDFIPAIKLVQEKGKKVVNAFFPKSSSYLLKNMCDASINLKKIL